MNHLDEKAINLADFYSRDDNFQSIGLPIKLNPPIISFYFVQMRGFHPLKQVGKG